MTSIILLLCSIPLFLRSEEVNHPLLERLDLAGLTPIHEPFLPPLMSADISIEISPFEIELLMKGEVVPCTGSIGDEEVNWIINCNNCHQLQLSVEEMVRGKINLLDHLVELIPNEGIGLVTWQNGMNNTFGDFRRFSNAVIEHLPEGVLGIGLYNPTEGFSRDFFRVLREYAGVDTATMMRTRQMMTTLTNQLLRMSSDVAWVHVCHSEGGLIASNSIAGMSKEHHTFLSEHFLCITLGSVFPVSTEHVREAINYYSEHDYLTRQWGEKYLDVSNYCIRILNCLTPVAEFNSFAGDHLFLDATYQYALEIAFQELLSRYND